MQQIQNNKFSKFTQEFMEMPPIAEQLDFIYEKIEYFGHQQIDNPEQIMFREPNQMPNAPSQYEHYLIPRKNLLLIIDLEYEGIQKSLNLKCYQDLTIKQLKNLIQQKEPHLEIEKMVLTYRDIICLDSCFLDSYYLKNYNRLSLKKQDHRQLDNIQINVGYKNGQLKRIIECDRNIQVFNFWKMVVELTHIKDDGFLCLEFLGHQLQTYSKETLKMHGVENGSQLYIIQEQRKGGCFPGYAAITLKDGTTKTISNININDELVSYDDKLNKFVTTKVISIKVGKARDFIQIQTQNNKIVCTPNHPFYTQDGWKAYKPNPDFNFQELNIQDKLLDINNQYQQILSIEEQLNEEQLIYNLTTDRPNTFIAFGLVVHNMDILHLQLPDGKSEELEISQTMLIQQIKILIHKRYKIPVERQQLYYHDRLLNDYRSLLDYQVVENSGVFFNVKLVDTNQNHLQKNDQLPDNILQFNLVSSDYQYTMDFSNKSTIGDLKNYVYFLEKNEQVILINKGQFLNEELNKSQISVLDNKSTILILNPSSGASSLKFMKEISSFFIEDINKIKESLQFLQKDQIAKITYFIETQIKEINQDQLKVDIYKKYQLHELLAIKIYSSDIVYRDLNIDIRTNQYSKWKPYLQCLMSSLRKCNYFKGQAYRGVMNYQDLDQYQKGKIVQWSQVSSISKKQSVCEQFSNNQGTQFYINLVSAKDIAQLSIYPSEEEIVMLPFSQFEVDNVQAWHGEAVKVTLRELPLPRQTNVILWVDDQPSNNYPYAHQLELDNPDVSVVFCTSTVDAMNVVKQYKWMIYLEGSHFRIVTDMVREENGKLNYLAGLDLLSYLFKEINYKNEVMVFCFDVKKAEENCKAQKIIGPYKISGNQVELMKFIRFQ